MTDGPRLSFRLRHCTAALLDTEGRRFELINTFQCAAGMIIPLPAIVTKLLAMAREPISHHDAEVLNSAAGFADNYRLWAHNLHSMEWAVMTSRGRVTKVVERSREGSYPLPPSPFPVKL